MVTEKLLVTLLGKKKENSDRPSTLLTEEIEGKLKHSKILPHNRMECYESMSKLLANKDGLTAFRDFLKSEFSDENIEFWLACEDFKKTKTPSQLAVKANKIYCEFIKTESPREVNIDYKTRELISQKMSHPTVNCFDDAQELILCLMAKDSFPRFLRSEHYKELVKKQECNGQKRWLNF